MSNEYARGKRGAKSPLKFLLLQRAGSRKFAVSDVSSFLSYSTFDAWKRDSTRSVWLGLRDPTTGEREDVTVEKVALRSREEENRLCEFASRAQPRSRDLR